MIKITLNCFGIKSIFTGIIGCLTVTWAAGVCAGDVLYKWEDDAGVPHYTETPPKGRQYEKVTVRGSGSGRTSSTDRANAPSTDEKEALTEKDPAAGTIIPLDPERCKVARERLRILNNQGRIRQIQDDGSYKYLTQEEIQLNIKEAQQAIKESCDV